MTEQFISADGYIIVAPMWNYGVPPMLKVYIDAVCIARKAFRMTENGADGVISV
ncbi:NAD(P)H-dependent oxidoreductase [Brevibacillus parabrevis]|uniref:NAD(P)H-dependent oxidoreductase n=1 Tax=Brevibacillus parabrevis TaxID=54914 RepID=UPI002E23A54F|nr:NAD(P)H-dependent oxidoreductase [Brevibacillus parabrevis]